MSTEGRWRPIRRLLQIAGRAAPLLVAVVLLIVGIGGGNALNYTSSPDFCNKCHSMSPKYDSWSVSEHAPDVVCIDCHSEPGAFGETVAHIKGVRYLYYALTGAKPNPAMRQAIPNELCVKCHAQDGLADRVNGVQVNHQKHLGQGASCLTCHAGLVHKAQEREPADQRFHHVCQGCHDSKQVVLAVSGPTSCTACHSDLAKVTPADHKTDWLGQHGKFATSQSCGGCHLSESTTGHREISRPASFPTSAGKDDCATCHQATMPHPKPYLSRHGSDALAQGAATCANCHSPQTRANPEARHASATFCSDCHSGVTMPHATGFLADHGKTAGTADSPVCATCHSSANPVKPTAQYAANDFCVKCHAGLDMPHTQKFTSDHGRQALASGLACQVCHSPANPVSPNASHASNNYCTLCHDSFRHQAGWVAAHGTQVNQSCSICHSEEKGGRNSCQACHQGKPGDKLPFHPDAYWFIDHRKVAVAKGEAACFKCHAEVKPSCSKCHANR